MGSNGVFSLLTFWKGLSGVSLLSGLPIFYFIFLGILLLKYSEEDPLTKLTPWITPN